jgi:curved DNA-binding protein CbpA
MSVTARSILGVKETADLQEIKTAYRSLVLKYHPDVNPHTIEYFKVIQSAYEELTGNSRVLNHIPQTRNFNFTMVGLRPSGTNGGHAYLRQQDVVTLLREAAIAWPGASSVLYELADFVRRYDFGDFIL